MSATGSARFRELGVDRGRHFGHGSDNLTMHYAALVLTLFTGGWEKVSEEYGMLVEKRVVAGSAFPEVRVSAHCDLKPAEVFDVIWAHHTYHEFVPYLKKLEILKNDGDSKVTYQQLNMPVISDRDYTVFVQRKIDTQTGVYESIFRAAPELGPPERSDHVRVTKLNGSWTLAPDEGGGTSVVYQIQTDPSGSIPAWIAADAQKKAAPKLVKAMIERALKLHPR